MVRIEDQDHVLSELNMYPTLSPEYQQSYNQCTLRAYPMDQFAEDIAGPGQDQDVYKDVVFTTTSEISKSLKSKNQRYEMNTIVAMSGACSTTKKGGPLFAGIIVYQDPVTTKFNVNFISTKMIGSPQE